MEGIARLVVPINPSAAAALAVTREQRSEDLASKRLQPLMPMLQAIAQDLQRDIALLEDAQNVAQVQQHLAHYAMRLGRMGD